MLRKPISLKRIRKHWGCRALAWVTTVVMASFAVVPAEAMAMPRVRPVPVNWNRGLPDGWTQFAPKTPRPPKGAAVADSRVLTDAEMAGIRGKGPYRNKYYSGVLPWQRQLRDVNLCNGNLFKSFTDIQVAPARGAGLVLQRTYNSNDERIGPFGIGWTHAYDIRVAEATTTDNVDRTDFFGGKHVYHRDADGLYTPPAYIFDELSSEYDSFLVTGSSPKVNADTEISMDGTTKHFFLNGDERCCDYIKDRYGNQTNLTYGLQVTIGSVTKNLLTVVTDPSGRTLTFSWTNLSTQDQPAWRITAVQGPLYRVTYDYNGEYNLSAIHIDPDGLNRTTTYGYITGNGESGLLASVMDSLNHTVSYTYTTPYSTPTGTLWVATVTEPGSGGSHVWTITPGTWDYTGFMMTTCTDNDKLAVYEKVDSYFRVVMTGLMNSAPAYYTTYDSANNVTQFQEGDTGYSGFWPWFHDSMMGSFSSAHKITTMIYGQHGNVLTQSVTGFSGETTTTTYYDASQYFQKASVTDPLGRVTTFGVGSNTDSNVGNRGSVLWVRDPGYNVVGSPSYHKEFDYAYNSCGQKTSETNMNGVVTNYSYGDAWGNLTQVVQDPGTGHLNRTTSMVYDSGGRATQSTDPSGYVSTFSYNTLGQPTSATFPATQNTPSEIVSYTYGSNGRLSTVTDNRGTTALAYESTNDRVSSVTDPVTGAISYTYRLNGARSTMSLPGGGTWTYAYHALDSNNLYRVLPKDDPNALMPMLETITDDQGRVCEYRCDIIGNLREVYSNQVYDGQGARTGYCYSYYELDNDGASHTNRWLKTVKHLWNSISGQTLTQKTLTQNIYTYNNAGMRTTNAIYDQNGLVRTESYGYDELYRLNSVNYGDGQTQSYAFDSMGNRTQKVDSSSGTENYSYNAANMLLSRGTNNYTNDLNGNTLTGGGRTNIWDSQNRLAQCTYNSITSTGTYAADGIRHRSIVGANTTDYILDSSMYVREKLNGSVNATYLVSPRGPEYRRDDSSGTVRWYVYDGLGSVLGECDPSGNLTATRSFDVYGAVRTSAGTSTSKHKFVGSLGHPSEDETGLIYMRARFMDPTTGAFLSEDKGRHGSNWLAYCGGNPVNLVDADGNISTVALANLLSKLLMLLCDAVLALYEFVALKGAGPGLLAAILAAIKAIHKGEMPSWTEIGMQLVLAIAMTAMSAVAGGALKWVNDAGEALQNGAQFAQAIRIVAFIHNMTLLLLSAEL